jgi:hypothetical protein
MFHETQDIDFVDPFVFPDFGQIIIYLLLGADEVTAIRE